MTYTIPAQVKAISFDIWKTLLGGNKAFTRVRLRLIFDRLGLPDVDIEQVRDAYLLADKYFNNEAERRMQDFGMAERLEMMFSELGINQPVPDAGTISAIQAEVGELRGRQEYLPSVLEPTLHATLRELRNQGYVLGLLSNTGIDNIQVMEPVLKALGLWDLFDVHLFTSEDGRAKPNPDLFRRMAAEFGVEPSEVLHVGDNRNADYRAIEAGLQAVLYAPEGSDLPHISSMNELLVLQPAG